MLRFVLTIWLAFAATNVLAAEKTRTDALNWYQNVYFPNWQDPASLDLRDVKKHFFSAYRQHEDTGSFTTEFPTPAFSDAIQRDIENGWAGDSLDYIAEHVINRGTTAITVKLTSDMGDSEDQIFCFWYLLSRRNDSWGITNVATIDCSQIP